MSEVVEKNEPLDFIREIVVNDLKNGKKSSPIYRHHVDFVQGNHYAAKSPYIETEPNQIVVDYMASMTDDYCTELYKYLFPNTPADVKYHGYFEDLYALSNE